MPSEKPPASLALIVRAVYEQDNQLRSLDLMERFSAPNTRAARLYGVQQSVSALIAHARICGFLVDVPRCPSCHRALTRGRANGKLAITDRGRAWVHLGCPKVSFVAKP